MGIKEENQRVTITFSKDEINSIKMLANVLNMHYTHLIHNIVRQYLTVFNAYTFYNKDKK